MNLAEAKHVHQRDAGPAYAHYSAKERKKIVTLQRRAAWLEKRMGECADGGAPFDKQELRALQWVLGKLANMSSGEDEHDAAVERSTGENK